MSCLEKAPGIWQVIRNEVRDMRNKIIGALDIVLGGVIAIGTRTFLHVCGGGSSMNMGDSMGGNEMKMACSGVPTASLIAGIVLAVIGLGFIVAGNKKAVSVLLGVLNVIAGIVVIGIPTFIVGVCGGAHMHCHMVTRPALIIVGVIAAVAGAVVAASYVLSSEESGVSANTEPAAN